MNGLYIVGAGGFGREVYSWLMDSGLPAGTEFAGFLDDNPAALHGHEFPKGVVGRIAGHTPTRGHQYICAIGSPGVRLDICRRLQSLGAIFPVLRHPSAIIGTNCRIGIGSIICPGVVITTNVQIGEFALLNLCATVGHDARIGNGVTLSAHADVTGFAVVNDGAFLGSHASVLPGGKVGEFAIVGAGSVVLRSVRPRSTVMGVPAKQILP